MEHGPRGQTAEGCFPGITGMVREEFIAEATGLLGDGNIEEPRDQSSLR